MMGAAEEAKCGSVEDIAESVKAESLERSFK